MVSENVSNKRDATYKTQISNFKIQKMVEKSRIIVYTFLLFTFTKNAIREKYTIFIKI